VNPGLQTASRTGGRAAITFTGTGHHLRPETVITVRRKPPSPSTGIYHHHRPERANLIRKGAQESAGAARPRIAALPVERPALNSGALQVRR
jgi:hypothetical protein